jgi:hypothetical protein
MLSSLSLCKNKEVLARNGGGEIGKEMCLNLYSMEESLLNMKPLTRFVSRLENSLFS